jgi:hypothetical protein
VVVVQDQVVFLDPDHNTDQEVQEHQAALAVLL